MTSQSRMLPTQSILPVSRWALMFAAAATAVAAVPPERAVVNQYCVGCHSAKMKAAGFALHAVNAQDDSEYAAGWDNVALQLCARATPSTGLPLPVETNYM